MVSCTSVFIIAILGDLEALKFVQFALTFSTWILVVAIRVRLTTRVTNRVAVELAALVRRTGVVGANNTVMTDFLNLVANTLLGTLVVVTEADFTVVGKLTGQQLLAHNIIR